MSAPPVQHIQIRDDSIRLSQFLKLADLVEDGSQARELLEEGAVLVNGRVETRRGAKLRSGDVVAVGPNRARVVTPPATAG
jgi:ribosome-associated protein